MGLTAPHGQAGEGLQAAAARARERGPVARCTCRRRGAGASYQGRRKKGYSTAIES